MLLKYFSRFNALPLEFLCAIFAGTNLSLYKMNLFKDRIAHINRSEDNETLSDILLILGNFIEDYKCFIKGMPQRININFLSISLSFSYKLFDLGFRGRSLDVHFSKKLCQKLNAAIRMEKYINIGEEKLRYVYDRISFSPSDTKIFFYCRKNGRILKVFHV